MSLNLDKSHWKRVAFGDVVRNVNETVRDLEAAGIDRVIAMEHMDPGELKISRWGSSEDGTTFTRRVKPGQTLFGKRRAYQRKVAYAEFGAICSGDIYTFEADETQLRGDLLPFLVQSDGFFEHALGTSAGSLSPRTNWRDLKDFEFDLPPLDEQKRIAHLLWAMENSRQATGDLHAAATSVREALIESKFVGDGAGTLQDLCDRDGIRIGPFGAQLHAHDYVDDGDCPVVMPQDMVDGRVSTDNIQRITAERAEELAVHRLRAGDVLLPRRGELDRRALITEAESGWLCGTGSVRVRVRDGVSQRAVYLALSSATTVKWLKANATGTTMPNLNAGIVARIPISLPSGRRLAEALQEVDGLDRARAAVAQQARSKNALRAALLAEIFGGE
ncbi:restriction endonuclease subunit S [Brachybacterium muris]|uniref:restriction endonuclease subunit S n=1 Tax=Brachybacterium muris TaxID=219301 RepID=UPI0021A6FD33|nr:restriction endonuclease subunit S [Brachybacterium muris]MCT1430547.1 restriction endonuclease subunit S [Brachybacterium muris]